jgi:hypothetical protein
MFCSHLHRRALHVETIQRPLFGVDTMVVNEVGPTLIESTSVVQS